MNQPQHAYDELYQQVAGELPGGELSWVKDLREQALGRFNQAGFPTPRQEAWKYTRLNALEKTLYAPVQGDALELSAEDIQQLPLATHDAISLVFVDGQFTASLSEVAKLPAGVAVSDLSQALHSDPQWLRERLTQDSPSPDALRDLNTTFMNAGAVIRVAANVAVEQPIHLRYISSGAKESASYTRNLVVLEVGSQARLVESFACLDDGDYVANTQADIRLAENAQLQHYKLQLEGATAVHLANTRVEQARGSNYQNYLFALGALQMRNDIRVRLNGEQAECVLNGLFFAQQRQHLDMHTTIEHVAPNCNSHETYHGIADQRGRGVFAGNVIVHPQAQQSNARMSSDNLLLSSDAEIDTKPQLEIYADDVKCSHGATIGQLDESVLFYLQSRGIEEAVARNLVLYAFASDSVESCPWEAFRDVARRTVLNYFPQSESLQELLECRY